MKSKLKSIMASILCVVTLLSLAACGAGKPESTPSANTPSGTSTPSTNPGSAPDVKVEVAEQVEELSFERLWLHTDLSQGAAWIEYKETADSDRAYGIINTEGEIIRVAGSLPKDVSSFSGGYSYVNYDTGSNTPKHFAIFDSMGNLTAQSTDDFAHRILCGGDGYYLVQKDYQTMTANETHYGVIDAQGNWIYEPTADLLSEVYDVRYLGDGIFYCHRSSEVGDVLLDAKRTSSPITVVSSENSEFELLFKPLGMYEGSVILLERRYGYYGGIIHRLDADGTRTIIETGDTDFESENENHYIEDVSAKFSEGVLFVSSNYYDENAMYTLGRAMQFIDMDGKVIADYSAYNDIRGWDGCFEFVDGYAAVLIRGADFNTYLEIIDKTGTCAFEPIKLDSDFVEKIYDGKVGCTIDGAKVWVDAQGNITDRPAVPVGLNDYVDPSFNNGYAVKDNQIINMDGEALPLHWAK